ncbi:MAG TPA: ROK family protein [bacterium]|jgi:polyphosphate glucokinase|nr:ROK family protein [bacterium]
MRKILVVDVGGSHVKALATGQKRWVKFASGPGMGPGRMVKELTNAVKGWDYDAVSLGYPGPVVHGRPLADPGHLGAGWVGFDFRVAFGKPVKIVNDAAMQALGNYRGGRMLFLGLGTGLGSAAIVDKVLEPMELAHLPYKKGRSFEDYVGMAGLERLGKKRWREHVAQVVGLLKNAFQAEDVVLGGGNARLLKKTPPGVRLADNARAFEGGCRLWEKAYGGPDA